MNETEIRNLLPRYADGELTSAEQRAAIEAALAESPQLQAELGQWRALRQAAQRGIANEPVPAGLAERVRTRLTAENSPAVRAVATSRGDRGRTWKLGVAVTAAAAAIVITVSNWPASDPYRGLPPTPAIEPNLVWAEHMVCINKQADMFGIRGKRPAAAAALLAEETGETIFVPDMSSAGWQLFGANPCAIKLNGKDVTLTHVYYRAANDPSRFASIFTAHGHVRLPAAAQPRLVEQMRTQCGSVPALVQTADFVLIAWTPLTQPNTALACADMSPEELQAFVRAAAANDDAPAQPGPTVVRDLPELMALAGF
jgi:anti-sigma factor RsiW